MRKHSIRQSPTLTNEHTFPYVVLYQHGRSTIAENVGVVFDQTKDNRALSVIQVERGRREEAQREE